MGEHCFAIQSEYHIKVQKVSPIKQQSIRRFLLVVVVVYFGLPAWSDPRLNEEQFLLLYDSQQPRR